MKNVYHLERGLNNLIDGRANPNYSTGQVIMPVLFGFLLRVKSFNELNFMTKNYEFSQLFPRGTKLAKIDAIRDTLKVMDIDGLKQINQHIVKKAIENKSDMYNSSVSGGLNSVVKKSPDFGILLKTMNTRQEVFLWLEI